MCITEVLTKDDKIQSQQSYVFNLKKNCSYYDFFFSNRKIDVPFCLQFFNRTLKRKGTFEEKFGSYVKVLIGAS